MWDVGSSSLTGDQTQVPCIGSVESEPLDQQGSPFFFFLRALILSPKTSPAALTAPCPPYHPPQLALPQEPLLSLGLILSSTTTSSTPFSLCSLPVSHRCLSLPSSFCGFQRFPTGFKFHPQQNYQRNIPYPRNLSSQRSL